LSGDALEFSPAACEIILSFGVTITCAVRSRCETRRTAANIAKRPRFLRR
jgi:hypothetical protein